MTVGRSLRYYVSLALLVAVGIACAAYVLVHQRAPLPFRDVYEVKAILTSAEGVEPGLGQPVQVAGVKVGQISDLRVRDGRAEVTMEIRRKLLPRMHANATAELQPITPLKDMRIELDPGRAPAKVLGKGATLEVDQTATPVALSTLLSSLDGDTRAFVTTLMASLEEGTKGRGPDMRRMLLALGPAAAQARELSATLAKRQSELKRLVTNVARVTDAAAGDGELASLVQAGHRTLAAIAEQEGPLRASLRDLPATVSAARSSLESAAEFAGELTPTLARLQPSVDRLPGALTAIGNFSRAGEAALKDQLRPLVRESRPMLRRLGTATGDLNAGAPAVTRILQVANYFLNELTHNPEGDDEGYLFWLAWFGHNWNSFAGTSDAHGAIGRTLALLSCQQLTQLVQSGTLLALLIGAPTACPPS
jgi:virulence factor Mce-like protein